MPSDVFERYLLKTTFTRNSGFGIDFIKDENVTDNSEKDSKYFELEKINEGLRVDRIYLSYDNGWVKVVLSDETHKVFGKIVDFDTKIEIGNFEQNDDDFLSKLPVRTLTSFSDLAGCFKI